MNTSSQKYGTDAHEANVASQNLNHGSSETKSTVVVLLVPTVNGNQMYRAETNGNVTQTVASGKALNRLTDLLAMAGNTAPILEVLGPRGGAAASIDERVKLKDSAAMILRYTVNGSVERLQKLISEALFKVAEKAANDNTTLASYASRFGVHAIAVTSESSSHLVVNSLRDQLESFERNEANFVPAAKATVDQINAPVIDWNATKAEVVLLEGAALSFVVRADQSRVNFLINPIKGNKVSNALDVFKRENQASVSIEEKGEALIAIGYDLAAMPDEEIAISYESERADALEAAGIAPSEEVESEDDDMETEGDDFSAPETLAGILLQAELDRSGLKKLVFTLSGKVLVADTEETLTAKVLDLVDGMDYHEFWNFVMAANTKLGGVAGFADYIHAESEEVEEETEEEEETSDSESEEETEDEGDDDGEEAEDDEEESDEDDSEEEEDEEEEEFSAAAEFASLIDEGIVEGELNREAIRAIARSDSFQLKTFKGQTAEDILEKILEALSQTEFADVEEFEQLVRSLAEIEVVAEHFPSFESYEVNPVDYSELFELEGGALTHDQRVAALESVGIEIEDDGKVAVLKMFEQYRLDNGYVETEAEEDSEDDEETTAEDSEEESEDDSEEESEEEEAEETEEGDDRFVAESSSNDLGTFLRVRQEQTLLVNFALTDRDTFESIAEELEDQSGVNYRVPFNMTDEVEGSMYLPLTVITDLLQGSAALPFMSERKTFNVETYSEKLANTMRSQIDTLLYEGRLEVGQDPREHGLVLGDFIEDEDEVDEDDLSEEYLNELVGDHVPMAALYNAHVSVRPVTVDTESTVLNTVVLNIALPCIWGLDKKKVSALVLSAYNRVVSTVGETDTKVYVGFTLNAGSLVSDEILRNVVKAVADAASDEIEVASFTTNDVQRVNEAEDLMEAAIGLGTENLPLLLLSSGVADAAFANGGDLTLLLSDISGNVGDEDEADE